MKLKRFCLTLFALALCVGAFAQSNVQVTIGTYVLRTPTAAQFGDANKFPRWDTAQTWTGAQTFNGATTFGSTISFGSSLLTFSAGQISWASVSKSGANLTDIPTRLWADLQSKPTSIAGLGVLNGAALDALGAMSTAGIVTQTAAGAYTARTITGTTNQVNVSNGNGVAGNPTLSLPQDIHTGATPTFAATILGPTADTVTGTGLLKVGRVTPTAQAITDLFGSMSLQAYGYSPTLMGLRMNGTSVSPTAVTTSQQLLELAGGGYSGSAFVRHGAYMIFGASENWTPTATGGEIRFGTQTNGATGGPSDKMILRNDGILQSPGGSTFTLRGGDSGATLALGSVNVDVTPTGIGQLRVFGPTGVATTVTGYSGSTMSPAYRIRNNSNTDSTILAMTGTGSTGHVIEWINSKDNLSFLYSPGSGTGIRIGHNTGANDYMEFASGTGLTTPNNISATGTTSDRTISIGASAGQLRQLVYRTGALARWNLHTNSVAEGGSATGSNLVLSSYNDDGTYRADAMTITRSTGAVAFPNAVSVGSNLTVSGAGPHTFAGNVLVGSTTDNSSGRVQITGVSGNLLNLRATDTATGAVDTGPQLLFTGHSGSGAINSGSISALKSNSTVGDWDTYLQFATRATANTLQERMRLTANGNLLIGTGTDISGTYGMFILNKLMIGSAVDDSASKLQVFGSARFGFSYTTSQSSRVGAWAINGTDKLGSAFVGGTSAGGAGIGSIEVYNASATTTTANWTSTVFSIPMPTASTSTTSGALQVAGGGGFQGALFAQTMNVTGAVSAPSGGVGQVGATSTLGLSLIGSGSSVDVGIYNKNGSTVMTVPTGTQNASFNGNVTLTGDFSIVRSSGTTVSVSLNQTGLFNWLLLNKATSGLFSIQQGGSDWLTIAPTTGATTLAGNLTVGGAGAHTIGGTGATVSIAGTSPLKGVRTSSTALDFPSVSATGGVQELTATVTGAAVGDNVIVTSAAGATMPANGLVLYGQVTAANTVTVRATNSTAGAIDPVNTTYRITVISF